MMISRKIQRACISIRILVEAEADSVRLAKVKCGLVQLVCGKLVGYRRAPLSARFDNLAQDCGAMGNSHFDHDESQERLNRVRADAHARSDFLTS